MLLVSEAARRVRRNAETIRRWISERKRPFHRVDTERNIDEHDPEELVHDEYGMLPLPDHLKTTRWGAPQPNWVRMIRRQRESH